MQTWARRGLQTALVTGGLLMLGTGIASAHENVSPDTPASPIDGGVSVPVHVGNNALGTPFGQKNLPGADRTVSTNEVTDAVTSAVPQSAGLPTSGVSSTTGKLPVALSKATPALTKATPGLTSGNLPIIGSAASGVTDKVSGLTKNVPGASSLPAALPTGASTDSTQALGGDPLLGNRGRVELVVPVDISGNAIALGGPASVTNDSNQTANVPDPVVTGFDPGSLTNNVVAVNYALPVQIANNAIGGAGNAGTAGSANQSATTGGDIVTNGSHRSLSGNVAAGQFTTPVQIAGNAVTGAGQASSISNNSTEGHSNGSILTDGSVGAGSGNVAAAPLAVPFLVDGQAIGAAGLAGANSTNTATTNAGNADIANAPRGSGDHASTMPGYLQTSGFDGVLSGNGAVPALANPVEVAGNAVSGIANTGTQGMTTDPDSAGGFTTTNGQGSTASGNLAAVPVADPAHVFGNGAAAIGTADGVQANSTNATAGGISYANGTGGVIAGNNASSPVAGSNDVFGSAGSVIGNAAGTGGNDVMVTSGGYTGTSGSGATGGGNIVQTPVGAPAEVFGTAASAGGSAGGTVPAESKTITAGGNSNTNDDFGTLSSNVVDTPTSLAGQVFSNAAGLVANDNGSADSRTTVTTGGDATGTGRQGTGSGNIVQVPTALPAQVMHNAGNLVGTGSALGSNTTNMGAGGDATADGSGGSVAGNVVSVPNSGPAQVFGNAVAGAANDAALADNETTTWAGGDTTTDGTAGSESGNVVSAQVIHDAQVFGDAAAAGGNALGHATNETGTAAAGSTTSHGDWGSVSGNLVTAPVTAIGQVFADGVSGVSNTDSLGANQLGSVDGGPTSTTGHGALSGLDPAVPAGVVAQVYKVPVPVLGQALAAGVNQTGVANGDESPAVDLPLSLQNAPTIPQFGLPTGTDALLPINKLPNLATLPLSFPHLGGFPGLSSLPRVPGLPGSPSTQDLPAVPALPGIGGIPAGLTSGLTNLPGGMSALSPLPAVPGLPALPTALPTGLPTGVPSTQDLPAGLPSLPTLFSVPSIADVPGLPSLPGLDLPNTSGLPSVPGLDGVPSVNSLPGVPAMPSLSGVPGASNVPGLDTVPSELSGFSGDLPLTGQLPTTPSTQSLPEVPLATPATLPGTGNLPSLPVDGLPIGQGVPALPVSLPDVPQVGSLPTVSSGLLPGSPDLLPNQADGLQSEQALPGIGGLGGELPGLAGLPVFSAPVLSSSLPTAGALPAIGADGLIPTSLVPALPTNGLTGASLPSVSQLSTPGMQDLPAFGILPELPSLLPAGLTLPGMPALPATPNLPTTQSFAVTPGLGGSDLDLPNFENAVPSPAGIAIGGTPLSSLSDAASAPVAGVQAPAGLSSADAPALSASDSVANSLRNLAGQGLDGVQLPSA